MEDCGHRNFAGALPLHSFIEVLVFQKCQIFGLSLCSQTQRSHWDLRVTIRAWWNIYKSCVFSIIPLLVSVWVWSDYIKCPPELSEKLEEQTMKNVFVAYHLVLRNKSLASPIFKNKTSSERCTYSDCVFRPRVWFLFIWSF